MKYTMIFLSLLISLCSAKTRQNNPLWQRLGKSPGNTSLLLSIALQSNTSHLQHQVRTRSELSSLEYGKYLNNSAIHEMLHDPVTMALWDDFLQTFETKKRNDNEKYNVYWTNKHADIIYLWLTMDKIEEIFQSEMYIHQHTDTKDILHRSSTEIKLPKNVEDTILFLDGLDNFPTTMQMQLRSGNKKSKYQYPDKRDQDPVVTGNYIRTLYNVPAGAAATSSENSLLIGSFLHEYYSKEDLITYLNMHSVPVTSLPDVKESCTSTGSPTSEASLDVQVALGVSWSSHSSVFCYDTLRNNNQVFSDANQEPFLKFMREINGLETPPLVVSISYSDDECAIPKDYAQAVNNEFMKAALKGITILVASGDNGVLGSDISSECTGDTSCNYFQTGFPSSSPYVTSVGGTQMKQLDDGSWEEIVASTKEGASITSGGGFSSIFQQPWYQVASYLSILDSNSFLLGKFNPAMRAYPDISAVSHHYEIILNDEKSYLDGTSASTPAVAGLISLLNEVRLSNNLPPLGFINPLLYAAPDYLFKDIVSGNNACGDRDQVCCPHGFSAQVGWDAATGLGALLFDEAAEYVSKYTTFETSFFSQSSYQVKKYYNVVHFGVGFLLVAVLVSMYIHSTGQKRALSTNTLADPLLK